MMPEFLQGTIHTSPSVREGYFLMLMYLPVTFGDQFSGFVESTVPCILRGLADVEEGVRDSAMRAGQRIIK